MLGINSTQIEFTLLHSVPMNGPLADSSDCSFRAADMQCLLNTQLNVPPANTVRWRTVSNIKVLGAINIYMPCNTEKKTPLLCDLNVTSSGVYPKWGSFRQQLGELNILITSISSKCQILGLSKAPPPATALLWGFLADCGTGKEQGYCGSCCEEVKAQRRRKADIWGWRKIKEYTEGYKKGKYSHWRVLSYMNTE